MPTTIAALFENLQSRNEFKRKSAVQELGKVTESTGQIISALTAARDSDPNADVRQAAVLALQAPIHQAYLAAHPDWADQAAAETHQQMLIPNADLRQLQQALKSKARQDQLRAIYTIRHLRRTDAVPDLVAATTSFSMLMTLQSGRGPDRKQAKALLLPALEALIDLSTPTVQPEAKWQGFLKTGVPALVSHVRASDEQKDLDEEEAQLNLKLAHTLIAVCGAADGNLLESVLKPLFSPIDVTKSASTSHLRYVIAADHLATNEARARAAVTWLCRGAIIDEERWTAKSNLGLAAGLLWAGFGTVLTAVINSVVEGVARDLAAREVVNAKSLLLLAPEAVAPRALDTASDQTRYLTAMHAYGTGLAKLAAAHPVTVKAELARGQRPIARVLLGFALALNGHVEAADLLRRHTTAISPEDWMTKLLAHEGLVGLANTEAGAPHVPLAEQVAALADRDLRVSTTVAYLLAGTQNPAYRPHLARLADSSEAVLRRAALPALCSLAQAGDRSAQTKLHGLAELEPDKAIREEARRLQAGLMGHA